MYDTYIVKRTQIYLEDEQADALAQRARALGTTASKMIREAIDEYLAEPDDTKMRRARFRQALEASFGIAPYLPDGATYVDELRTRDHRRDIHLERRRDG
jgi:predicted DNA-binding protein